jgi:hypothetical protein
MPKREPSLKNILKEGNDTDMIWKKILYYLDLRNLFRRPEGQKPEINLRMMHGINRISIYIFLFALIVMLIKLCGR